MVLVIAFGWWFNALERFGKIGTFSDVLLYSAFDKDVFYGYSDVACNVYGNVCLGRNEVVSKLCMPYMESSIITSFFL